MHQIFVATPSIGFGELICQSLEEAGSCKVGIASGEETALQMIAQQTPALVVLDSDLGMESLARLAKQLRELAPAARLLVIPPDDETAGSILDDVGVDGFLSKPFYLPDLLETVHALLGIPPNQAHTQPEADVKNEHTPTRPQKLTESWPRLATTRAKNSHQRLAAPAWFQDLGTVRGVLNRQFSETAAYGAFILRYDQVWAATGQLTELTAGALAMAIIQQWSQDNGTDLARFVHLDELDGDCMLYATSLGSEYILTLIFDAETPFSMIRKQASTLARNVKQPPDLAGELEMPAGAI